MFITIGSPEIALYTLFELVENHPLVPSTWLRTSLSTKLEEQAATCSFSPFGVETQASTKTKTRPTEGTGQIPAVPPLLSAWFDESFDPPEAGGQAITS